MTARLVSVYRYFGKLVLVPFRYFSIDIYRNIDIFDNTILEGTMNAERYIKVLEQHMLPSRGRVFQQDNAKPHTAAITTAWLRSGRVRVLNWSAVQIFPL